MSTNTLTKSARAPTSKPPANIWHLMNYHIPRGKCNHKTSLIAPGCPCLRFMLNPLQAASSFACDGCRHHASFHSLRDKEEDAIACEEGREGKRRRGREREVVDLEEEGEEEGEEGERRVNGAGNGKRVRREG